MRLDKSVAAVKVVCIQGGEGLMDFVLCTPDGVRRAPRLFPVDGGQVAGQFVHALEAIPRLYQALGIFAYEFHKFLGKTLANDKDDFVEAGMHGVINRVMQQCFLMWSEGRDLFQASETRTHARCHDQKGCSFCCHNIKFIGSND